MVPTSRARIWAAILLAAYGVGALLVALIPRPIDEGMTPWIRAMLAFLRRHGLAGWISYEFVEACAHVVAFVPVGVLTVVAIGRRLTWLAVVAGSSLCLFAEFTTAAAFGEPPSAVDVALNAVGVIAGSAIGYWASGSAAGRFDD